MTFYSLLAFPPTLRQKCPDCDRPGETYHGFPLKNHVGNQHYLGVTSVEDCRTLCKLVYGCNFFVYQRGDERKCTLKYGVGQKKSPAQSSNYVFGSKNCEEDRSGRDLELGPKTGEPLSAAVPASAAVGGLLLIVIVVIAVICLRCLSFELLVLIIRINVWQSGSTFNFRTKLQF